MDETKERRVQNVYVGDEPIDLEKTYTLAGSVYVLTKGGDGLTMLDGATVVQSDGYTEGLYCNECEKFISGHEELPLDEEYHVDEDVNDTCDLCGKEGIWDDEDEEFECEHLCHSENTLIKIIWNIINFFNRILKLSPECECGELHY